MWIEVVKNKDTKPLTTMAKIVYDSIKQTDRPSVFWRGSSAPLKELWEKEFVHLCYDTDTEGIKTDMEDTNTGDIDG